MISLAIPAIFLVLGLILGIHGHNKGRYRDGSMRGEEGGGWFLIAISAVVMIFLLICIPTTSKSDQFRDREELTRLEKTAEIYRGRADDLLTDFAYALVELYPEHEAKIFDEIARDNELEVLDRIDIYAARYPEIQASSTMTAYVSQAREIKDAIYVAMVNWQTTAARMRYRQVNPWVWGVPKIAPEN